MQGLQKSKRVSWASDGNLCQVRLFLSEECPSQVGVGGQDHLQAKKTVSLFNGLVADDNLPPGFEGFNPTNQSNNNLVQIPVVNWRSPPKFIWNVEWQVASGGESKEVEIQNQRELRVLEAYYPRQSAIPPNSVIAQDAEVSIQDDRTVPLVPITPIEEDDISGDPSFDSSGSASASLGPGPSPMGAQVAFSSSQGFYPNHNGGTSTPVVASSIQEDALKAALTAVANSNDQIDPDLLVKILGNPTILEHIVKQQGPLTVPQSFQTKPISPGPPGYKLDHPLDLGSSTSEMIPNPISYPFPNGSIPITYPQPVPPLHGVVPQVGPIQPGPTKDLSYLKNLVQQHGEERQPELHGSYLTHQIHHHQGIVDQDVDNSKPRDGKPKSMKPCLYFNSSKGCRHGANCVYQHDMSSQQRVSSIPEMQGAKRLKMDREIKRSQSYS